MSRARETYFCLRIVEYTSIPLTLCLALYLLSGYGMISPVPDLVGLTYIASAKIHTLPLLRIATAALSILHFYGGALLLLNRNVRNERIRKSIKTLVLVIVLIFSLLIALSEIAVLLD